MSPWREAVAAWNERHKTGDKPEECPKCQQPRGITVQAVGQQTTTAYCAICAFHWVVR